MARRGLFFLALGVCVAAVVYGLSVRSGRSHQSHQSFSVHRYATLPVSRASRVLLTFATPQDGVLAAGTTFLRTTNGGRVWVTEATPAAPLRGLTFVGPHHGWAWNGNSLYATDDGGQIWHKVARLRSITDVQFLTTQTGWAISHGLLRRTGDGGRRWVRIRTPSAVQSLAFETSRRGWVAGQADIWYTSDGGRQWTPHSVPPVLVGPPYSDELQGWHQSLVTADGALWDQVQFVGGGYAGGAVYVLLYSRTASAPWAVTGWNPPRPGLPVAPPSTPGVMVVLNTNRALAVASCWACHGFGTTTVAVTTNAGTSWHATILPGAGASTGEAAAGASAQQMWVATLATSSPHLYAIRLYMSRDGGQDWRSVVIAVRR